MSMSMSWPETPWSVSTYQPLVIYLRSYGRLPFLIGKQTIYGRFKQLGDNLPEEYGLFLIGKATISKAIFNSFFCVHQRIADLRISMILQHPLDNLGKGGLSQGQAVRILYGAAQEVVVD